MTALAPIALFVYNRLWHTRQTIEALQKNELAIESNLIIFSDAPKSDAYKDAVDAVRLYIRQIAGFRSVTIVEREENFGLARSIIEGVTFITNKYDRIIVLEDDLVTSPYFLMFMNDALNAYQDDEKVMHISGYMFPIEGSALPETFFLRTASCWGWATWQRAWKYFDKNPEKLSNEFTDEKISRFNMDGTYNFWSQVEQNKQRALNTWAIFWYASIFQLNGLCLHPKISMINNIGHDATGEHCAENNDFSSILAIEPVSYFEKNIDEHVLALAKTKKFFQAIKPSLLSRIVRRLKAG
ncbi:glycosyltransferase family 2 protein [Herminiimonas aquatilis]|uniref:Glycosyltransferase family 2 protein n=1 Tax=Herminiimonas aquatilis TaxID=345342 RepID=A0ABW2JAA1_9BURK